MPNPTCACDSCVHSIFAREISHRSANVIQQAIAAIHLGRRADPGLLDIAMSRLTAAADLHRTLGEAPAGPLDVGYAITTVCEAAIRAAGGDASIGLGVSADLPLADANAARPLLMIASECVMNSVKHAFGNVGGNIEVSLRDDGHATDLVIQDDGRCSGWRRVGSQGRGIVDDLAVAAGGRVRRTVTAIGSAKVSLTLPTIAASALARSATPTNCG